MENARPQTTETSAPNSLDFTAILSRLKALQIAFAGLDAALLAVLLTIAAGALS